MAVVGWGSAVLTHGYLLPCVACGPPVWLVGLLSLSYGVNLLIEGTKALIESLVSLALAWGQSVADVASLVAGSYLLHQ